jgi:hypothetical protein
MTGVLLPEINFGVTGWAIMVGWFGWLFKFVFIIEAVKCCIKNDSKLNILLQNRFLLPSLILL